jgi:hypothetical protein
MLYSYREIFQRLAMSPAVPAGRRQLKLRLYLTSCALYNIVLPYSEGTTKINALGDPSLRHTKLRQQGDKNPSYGTVSLGSSIQFADVYRHVRRGLFNAFFSDDGGSTHL